MGTTLVVILALMWAVILVPSAFRGRSSSPGRSVGGFEKAMDVLTRQSGEPGRNIMVPADSARIVGAATSGREAVLARRRRAFTGLTGAVGTTFLLGVAFAGPFWVLFGMAVAAMGGYIALLLKLKEQRDTARDVVRMLPVSPGAMRHEEQAEPIRAAVGGGSYDGVQVVTRPDEPWHGSTSVRIRRWSE